MSLIAMAVWSNNEPRISYTKRTIESLFSTVDLKKHRLIISDNGSCEEMQVYFRQLLELNSRWSEMSQMPTHSNIQIIHNGSNLGTAKAINAAWKFRKLGENCIKMDDDCIVNKRGWVDEMDEVITRYPKAGLVCLKRRDCWENPDHESEYWRSKLKMIPQKPGQKWIVIEVVNTPMGTVQMYSSALIDRIGALYQMDGLYGWDDGISAVRSNIAGFDNCFLPHIDITNLDEGDAVPSNAAYTQWKKDYATQTADKFHQAVADYRSGKLNIFHPL